MFSHKTNGRIFIIFTIIFIATLVIMIYITQHRTNQIVNQLALDRTQAAKHGLENYLDDLSKRAMLNGELIARQDELIVAIHEYTEYNADKENHYTQQPGHID